MPKRSAPADQDEEHTAKDCGGQSPKSNDIPAIDKNLFGKKYGSRAPKRYKKVKTRYQANWREKPTQHNATETGSLRDTTTPRIKCIMGRKTQANRSKKYLIHINIH